MYNVQVRVHQHEDIMSAEYDHTRSCYEMFALQFLEEPIAPDVVVLNGTIYYWFDTEADDKDNAWWHYDTVRH